MLTRRRRAGALPLLATLLALAVAALASLGPHPVRAAHRAAPGADAAGQRLCVTRHGVCRTVPLPLDEPCGCPHPPRGTVPGRVQRLDGGARADGWLERDADDPPEAFDP